MSGQGFKKQRANTPRGQMSGGNNGPAIMMMPDHVRRTFMPNPPLKHLPPFKRHVLASDNYVTDEEEDTTLPPLTTSITTAKKTIPTSFPRKKRGAGLTGVSTFLHHFERTQPPERKVNPTPQSLKKDKDAKRKSEQEAKLKPLIEAYREEQKQCAGEFTNGMNCYNTLFVGRLAYEVTERKLLREMEAYGPVKDLKLITDQATGKSRGYAFVEYEHEEDMKRAYRAADGMKLEGRSIVVDVERGHTVPNWLPRRLGGGLGGTRLGGKDKNIFMAGRFDPSKQPVIMAPPPPMMGMGPPPPHHHHGHGPPGGMGPGGPMGPPGFGGQQHGRGGPPQHGGRYNDRGPPPGYGGGGGGGRYDDRGPPPPGYQGRFDDRGPPGYGGGGGGRYNDRGPPPGYHNQRGRYGGGGGGGGYNDGGYGGDRKRRREPSPPR
eukprot:CAMPEP_0201716050 /NCGR_PEP_ID=MMETSP0593-20130828/2106_1 /ASSEMBLY_ACC=CAM_ASM_000672 /TAXON_ID=267983 /ORGANISM="Skeletonema japonicum, Strain CCMP2506" /LENGTH=432 /DNA_ID=CAMNT_0048205731 /DNA_START=39 /DNA_END=1334 /DNA_ORIENTATION=-